jgi:diguanylate cyclase (GGDEF)-like protein
MAADDSASALAALETAADAATRRRQLPVMCKALAALSQRYAAGGRFEEAWRAQVRLAEASEQLLLNRASARYYLLRIEHELSSVREERDREHTLRHESEALARQLTELNAELSRRMREVEELQSQLAREAVHDPLTGLFNRRYLDSALPGLAGAAERHDTPLTLALIDLDYFKNVNDRHGHLAGDKVLRRIGKLLGSALRPSDIVARWGGEEFVGLLHRMTPESLATIAEKLRLLVESSFIEVDGERVRVTVSVGATFIRPGDTVQSVIARADRLLYASKTGGRNRVTLAA